MTKIANFARALYSLAEEENIVKKVYDEVQWLLDYIHTDEQIVTLFQSQVLTKNEKSAIIESVFAPNFSNLICNFLRAVSDMHEFHQIKRILKKFLATVEQIDHTRFVRVVSAIPLKQADLNKIKSILEQKIELQLIVRNHVDPNVIAGFKIESETRSFDWTIQGKLKAIEASLRWSRLK